jgi:hypothetical protein
MGTPAQDRWQDAAGGPRYRVLSYPDRGCTIVLMAPDSKDTGKDAGQNATYIGALDASWNRVHSAKLSKGDAGALLSRLPRF